MKLIQYQTYYIATDANHVTQHRRIMTPWFYVRLKPVKYVQVRCSPEAFITIWFNLAGIYTGWKVGNIKIYDASTVEKLELLTMVFNYQDKQNEAN